METLSRWYYIAFVVYWLFPVIKWYEFAVTIIYTDVIEILQSLTRASYKFSTLNTQQRNSSKGSENMSLIQSV